MISVILLRYQRCFMILTCKLLKQGQVSQEEKKAVVIGLWTPAIWLPWICVCHTKSPSPATCVIPKQHSIHLLAHDTCISYRGVKAQHWETWLFAMRKKKKPSPKNAFIYKIKNSAYTGINKKHEKKIKKTYIAQA